MVPQALSHPSRLVASKRDSKPSSFSDSVTNLLDRIDCRRADSTEEREAIFRLRYQAYLREGAISANPSGMFSDPFDETPNVYLFGLYISGELASSIRIHVGCKANPQFPSLEVFSDVLQPELDAGKVIVDPTRFVADERLSRLYRGLPYATLRLSMVAAEHFRADHVLAAVRVEHQAFYRRAFNQRVICEPRPYPQLAKPISLMAVHYPSVVEQLCRQYPFIPSTAAERRMLFERPAVRPEPRGALRKNQPLS
jgi:N-acyl-L-homoserine lactone synthetase